MAIVNEAEKLMVEIMARNDPSHDKYHGKSRKAPSLWLGETEFASAVQRVRKTALSLAHQMHPTPDLLVIELGTPIFFSKLHAI